MSDVSYCTLLFSEVFESGLNSQIQAPNLIDQGSMAFDNSLGIENSFREYIDKKAY